MKYRCDFFDLLVFVCIFYLFAFSSGCDYGIKELEPKQVRPSVTGFGDSTEQKQEKKSDDNPRCELADLKSNGLDYHDYNRTEYLCRYRVDTSYEMKTFEIAFFYDYRGYLNTGDRQFRFVRYKYSPAECKYVVINVDGRLEFEISNPRVDEYRRLRSFFMWDLYENKVRYVMCDIIYGPIN